jgi:hypothetical protein
MIPKNNTIIVPISIGKSTISTETGNVEYVDDYYNINTDGKIKITKACLMNMKIVLNLAIKLKAEKTITKDYSIIIQCFKNKETSPFAITENTIQRSKINDISVSLEFGLSNCAKDDIYYYQLLCNFDNTDINSIDNINVTTGSTYLLAYGK